MLSKPLVIRMKGLATDKAIESLIESKNMGFPIHIIDDLEEACKLVGELAPKGARETDINNKQKQKKMQE